MFQSGVYGDFRRHAAGAGAAHAVRQDRQAKFFAQREDVLVLLSNLAGIAAAPCSHRFAAAQLVYAAKVGTG